MNKTEFHSEKNKLTVKRTFDAPIDEVWKGMKEGLSMAFDELDDVLKNGKK